MSTPPILRRLLIQLRQKGITGGKAHAIATSSLQRSGNLKPHSTTPTAKGIKRGNMTPGQRANDRAAKYNGGKPSDYKYQSHNNLSIRKK